MIRRLFVYAILATAAYFGYQQYLAYQTVASNIRQEATTAAEAKSTHDESDPIGTAVRRRRAEEQSVQTVSSRP